MLIIWDIAQRRELQTVQLEFPSRSVAISPSSRFLVVGCLNGHVLIYDYRNTTLLMHMKARKTEITEIKFSPKGKMLAIGGKDTEIYIYDARKKFKRHCKIQCHQAPILHFDFSKDGSILRSMCSNLELIYFDLKVEWKTKTNKVKYGKRKKNGPTDCREKAWASETCTVGWAFQGIWPSCSNGQDINAVDISPSRRIIATGDDFGFVKLFKYPSTVPSSGFNKFIGHSHHVTNVRFSSSSNHLITIGGKDRAVFLWAFDDVEIPTDNHGTLAELPSVYAEVEAPVFKEVYDPE